MQSYKKKKLKETFLSYLRGYVILQIFLFVSLLSYAQETGISLKVSNVPLHEILKEIERQSEYSFAYNHSQVDISGLASVSVENAEIKEVLEKVLGAKGYEYRLTTSRIVIFPRKKRVEIPVVEEEDEEKMTEHQEARMAPAGSVDTRPNMVVVQKNDPFLSAIKTRTNGEYTPLSSLRFKEEFIPRFALKTNLLYDLTSTINLGVEWRFAERMTLDLSVNYNPWTFSGNSKVKHLLIQPELRYWLYTPFKKHFLGVHTHYARFNVGNVKLPLGMAESLKDYRYQGNLYGAGLTYGYHWYLSPRWSIEMTVGVGYSFLDYNQYACQKCGSFIETGTRHYLGLDKVGLSLIYMIK